MDDATSLNKVHRRNINKFTFLH